MQRVQDNGDGPDVDALGADGPEVDGLLVDGLVVDGLASSASSLREVSSSSSGSSMWQLSSFPGDISTATSSGRLDSPVFR